MKCIHCNSDSNYKARVANGGRCYACMHPFAFEPKNDPFQMADGLFQRAVQDVSSEGTLAFTERQLWYEVNRRLLRKVPYLPAPYGIGAAAVGLGGVAAGLTLFPPLFLVGIVGAAVTVGIGLKQGQKHPRVRYPRMQFETFQQVYLSRYETVHGALEKLVRVVAPRAKSPAATLPPDVTAYSFDRALITQDAEIAAMLVANRFHFENNCAILSGDRRYPQNGLFDTILEMLRRNPRLMVFVLHDASSIGLSMYGSMRDKQWFPDTPIRAFDLGLRPLHAIKSNFVLTKGHYSGISPEVVTVLTPEEQKWLAEGNIAEVATIRPERLMKAVFHGFQRAQELVQSGNYDDGYAGGGIFFIDTGPGVYMYGGTGGGYTGDSYAYDSFG
ncbi:MAG: hypothetical protein OHK0029_04220 [Armatimonadaceae bacterium]